MSYYLFAEYRAVLHHILDHLNPFVLFLSHFRCRF